MGITHGSSLCSLCQHNQAKSRHIWERSQRSQPPFLKAASRAHGLTIMPREAGDYGYQKQNTPTEFLLRQTLVFLLKQFFARKKFVFHTKPSCELTSMLLHAAGKKSREHFCQVPPRCRSLQWAMSRQKTKIFPGPLEGALCQQYRKPCQSA